MLAYFFAAANEFQKFGGVYGENFGGSGYSAAASLLGLK